MKMLVDAIEKFLESQKDGATVNDECLHRTQALNLYKSKRRETPRHRLYTAIHQAVQDEGVQLPDDHDQLHEAIDAVVQEVERRLE